MTRAYKNGNIVCQIDEQKLKEIQARPTSANQAAWMAAQNMLDEEQDIVFVTGEIENIDGRDGWRMFSFQTMKEYFITPEDVESLVKGERVRLISRPATQATKESMLWIPGSNS